VAKNQVKILTISGVIEKNWKGDENIPPV